MADACIRVERPKGGVSEGVFLRMRCWPRASKQVCACALSLHARRDSGRRHTRKRAKNGPHPYRVQRPQDDKYEPVKDVDVHVHNPLGPRGPLQDARPADKLETRRRLEADDLLLVTESAC